jgi:hypothetical protein
MYIVHFNTYILDPSFLDSVAKAKGDVILRKPTTGGFLFPNLEIVTVNRRSEHTEAVFLNFYGAQKSIPRNRFRQPM